MSANPNFNLLDTAVGDRVLNAAAVAAIMVAAPAPVAATTLTASGTSVLTGAVSGAGFVAAVNAVGAAKGTVVINGTAPATVADAAVTANSTIIFTLKTVGGTVGALPAIQTITPGTGFTVAGTASDTSTYNYAVIG
jgi:hypothetical protein